MGVVIDDDASVLKVGSVPLQLGFLGERQHLGLGDDAVQLSYGDFVVGVEDETVVRPEVAGYLHLGLCVVLHLVVVAVQMVGSDVCDDCYVGPEIIGVVELEAADFQHIVIVLLGSHLKGVALAYVPAEACVQPCLLKQVVDQGGGRRLAVRSSDADFLRAVVAGGEFYLRDYVYSFLPELPDDGCSLRYARTLDYFVGIENLLPAVSSLLVADAPFVQGGGVFALYLTAVGQEYVEAFYFCEDSCANSALCSSKNNQSCHTILFSL